MIGDKNLFMKLKAKSGRDVRFGDNSKGHIEGISCISNNSSTLIRNVLLVGGLKHNLLNISQLCDKGHKVIFESMFCQVINVKTNKLVFISHRQGNVYVVYFDNMSSNNVCLMAKKKMKVGYGI